jgi:hypothetical protein
VNALHGESFATGPGWRLETNRSAARGETNRTPTSIQERAMTFFLLPNICNVSLSAVHGGTIGIRHASRKFSAGQQSLDAVSWEHKQHE